MNVRCELRFGAYDTRRNLPPRSGRKRGEANFLGAFIRAYMTRVQPPCVYGRQFAVPGCGVADFVVSGSPSCDAETNGGSPRSLLAVETKLTDWKKALQQAYRYRYYANAAVVVLPHDRGSKALAATDVFQRLGVGLWTFDASSGVIQEHVAASAVDPLNPAKRDQALALIERRIGNLRR